MLACLTLKIGAKCIVGSKRWVALGSRKGFVYILSTDDWQLIVPSLDKQFSS